MTIFQDKKNAFFRLCAVFLALLITSVGIPGVGYAQVTQGVVPKGAIVNGMSDLNWKPNPVYKDAYVAVLWGDPNQSAYGMLRTFAGGTTIPMHSHKDTVKIILMSGIMTLGFAQDSTRWFGAGMYTSLPGGLRHTQTCITDCMYFESADKAFMTSIQCSGEEGSEQRADTPCKPLGK